MNIGLPEAQIAALCEKAGVRISDIETLPSGGTHLVCITSEGAGDPPPERTSDRGAGEALSLLSRPSRLTPKIVQNGCGNFGRAENAGSSL
jgi:hypothetical protein